MMIPKLVDFYEENNMVGAQSVADLENPVKGEILPIFLTAGKAYTGFIC